LRTVNLWNNLKIIFAKEHPDLRAYADDPDAELKRIKGEEVGFISDPKITTEGRPRLLGKLNFIKSELEKFILDGDLELSTGLWISGKIEDSFVTPNHVLVFRPSQGTIPRDFGSGILNATTEEAVTDEKVMGLLETIKEKLFSFDEKPTIESTKEEINEQEKIMDDKTEITVTETEEYKTLMNTLKEREDALNAALAKAEEYKNMIDSIEAKEQKDKFEQIIESHFVKGAIDTDEKKEELFKQFTEDKDAFYMAALKSKAITKEEAEGQVFTEDEDSDLVAAYKLSHPEVE
jgi:hypothetical protein